MVPKKKLVTKEVFFKRVIRSILFAFICLLIWLGMGMAGYRLTVTEYDWYECLLNASMIISGILFLSALAILITPNAHRIFINLHVEDDAS